MLVSTSISAGLMLVAMYSAKPLHPPLPGPGVVQDTDFFLLLPIIVAIIVCLGVVITAALVVITLSNQNQSAVPDSDFVDVTAHEQSDEGDDGEAISVGGKVVRNGKFVRGRDIVWVEVGVFTTAPDYFASDLCKNISKNYTATRKRQFNYAEIIEYRCKYARKLGFLPCPIKMRVLFLSHCQEVRIETSHECQDHQHEEEAPSLLNNKKSSNYRWSSRMNDIIEQCVSNHGKPKVAMRNMEQAGCFLNINRPTMEQVYNKMAAVKKSLNKNPELTNTFEMRQLVQQHLSIPEDPHEAYIPYYEINDEDSQALRFNIIFSTSNCLSRSGASFFS